MWIIIQHILHKQHMASITCVSNEPIDCLIDVLTLFKAVLRISTASNILCTSMSCSNDFDALTSADIVNVLPLKPVCATMSSRVLSSVRTLSSSCASSPLAICSFRAKDTPVLSCDVIVMLKYGTMHTHCQCMIDSTTHQQLQSGQPMSNLNVQMNN